MQAQPDGSNAGQSPAASRAPLSRLGWVIALVLLGILVARIVRRPDSYQWDLRTYHAAAQAFRAGLDPYEPGNLDRFVPGSGELPFIYPPLLLYALVPLTWMPVGVAHGVWLLLKLAALGALLWIWHRHFVSLTGRPLAALFLLYAFGSTLPVDLIAGNVSIFEQLGLWLAFALLLRGRVWPFCVLVGLVAQIKLVPALLLGLLWIVPPRPRWGAFVAGALGTAALLGTNLLLHPSMTLRFLQAAAGRDERAPENPSGLALARELVAELGRPWAPVPGWVGVAAWGALVAVILVLTALAVLRHREGPGADDARWRLYLGLLAYGLVVPRFMSYSYILLLVPALHAITALPLRRVPLLAVLLVLPTVWVMPPYLKFLVPYLPYFGALLLWWEQSRWMAAPGGAPPAAVGQGPAAT